MKIAVVVAGGVDRSGERRVIPALLAVLRRLSMLHEVHVFATHQEDEPSSWMLEGAHIHNVGLPRTLWRAVNAIVREHRKRPFDVVQSFWAGRHGALAVGVGALLRAPGLVEGLPTRRLTGETMFARMRIDLLRATRRLGDKVLRYAGDLEQA